MAGDERRERQASAPHRALMSAVMTAVMTAGADADRAAPRDAERDHPRSAADGWHAGPRRIATCPRVVRVN